MATRLQITVNGKPHRVQATADTPLLYVLRNELKLQGPRFGCGLAQCGACTVHLDGQAIRSCITPVAAATEKPVTTLEGLAAAYKPGAANGNAGKNLHPVQQAFIDEQASQCGYCLNGWIMTSAALLAKNPNLTDAEIRQGLSGLKCRCGAHMRILRAVKSAAKTMTA
ncbi:MAG TPA: (2Fe-2S)-binding protein [Acidiferrobacterales bacterium]|nr:(2Fe-2S)-binding protein [Acidiferrobacterales bacterium]